MFAAKHSFRTFSYSRRQHSQSITSAGFLLIRNVSILSENLPAVGNRSMSSTPMMEAEAEEESRFALILGKPGGGKGTISGKILKVSRKRKTSWIFRLQWRRKVIQCIVTGTKHICNKVLSPLYVFNGNS